MIEKIVSWVFVFLAYRICPLVLKLQNASDSQCNRVWLTDNKAHWTIDRVYSFAVILLNKLSSVFKVGMK